MGHFKYGIGIHPKPGEPGGPGGSIGEGGPSVDEGGYVTVGNLKPVPETPQITNNASKSGSYNPVTKTITWTINLNYVRQSLVDATFKDILQDIVVDGKTVATQTYVPGSLKLNYFSIKNSIPLQIEIGNPLEKDVDYQVVNEFSDGKTLDLSFMDQTDRDKLSVSVSFETTIDGVFVPEKGEGKASFFNQGEFVNNNKSQTVEASVSVSSDRPFAEKNGNRLITLQYSGQF